MTDKEVIKHKTCKYFEYLQSEFLDGKRLHLAKTTVATHLIEISIDEVEVE